MNTMVKCFNDVRDAFNYLVNEAWESLTPEQRKRLKIAKSNFNHATISVEKMEEILTEFGSVKKTFEFELK